MTSKEKAISILKDLQLQIENSNQIDVELEITHGYEDHEFNETIK